ncbi:hypothetical protein JKP88DRAFT_265123 [Tribonema minus]|uniref:Protein kinase domain-containing protein n=1 Tax=Tribonema minus TaxID=303371 RepID=A0A835YMF7_9STRA|nr:hypothetical protein JKP88DRAFT_265123 [Tribonema minus]
MHSIIDRANTAARAHSTKSHERRKARLPFTDRMSNAKSTTWSNRQSTDAQQRKLNSRNSTAALWGPGKWMNRGEVSSEGTEQKAGSMEEAAELKASSIEVAERADGDCRQQMAGSMDESEDQANQRMLEDLWQVAGQKLNNDADLLALVKRAASVLVENELLHAQLIADTSDEELVAFGLKTGVIKALRRAFGAAQVVGASAADAAWKRQLDAIQATTLDTQAELKRFKVSETTFNSDGQRLLTSCVETSDAHSVLPTTDPPRLEVVQRLLAPDLQEKWDAAETEADLQVLFCEAIVVIVDHIKATLRRAATYTVLDTHEKGYNKCPTAKIDVSLSNSPEALWTTLISLLELKFDLSKQDQYVTGLSQVLDRFRKICDQQPHRQFGVFGLLGRTEIGLIRLDCARLPKRTGRLKFSWDSANEGFQALLALLSAKPNEVGYSTPILPAAFTASNRRRLRDFVPIAVVTRAGISRHATYVYKALMAERDIVALKVAPQCDVEHEVAALDALAKVACVPRLHARGSMPPPLDDFHYIVTTPVGQHIGTDAAPALIMQVVLDVAVVIQAMSQMQLLHRQVNCYYCR